MRLNDYLLPIGASLHLGVVLRQSSCCLGTLAVNATVAARPGTEA